MTRKFGDDAIDLSPEEMPDFMQENLKRQMKAFKELISTTKTNVMKQDPEHRMTQAQQIYIFYTYIHAASEMLLEIADKEVSHWNVVEE